MKMLKIYFSMLMIYFCLMFYNFFFGLKFNNEGVTQVDNKIEIKVDSVLKAQDCLAIEISSKGYCTLGYSNINTHYLYSNAICAIYLRGTTNILDCTEPRFATAFKDTILGKIQIQIHRGHGNNNAMFLNLTVGKNDFLSNLKIVGVDKNWTFDTHKCSLILNKSKYSIGDTIKGFTYYQGKNEHSWKKYEIYFSCVLGSSENLLDYINTYPKCTGIVKELGFGKHNNIIAPPIGAQQKDKGIR